MMKKMFLLFLISALCLGLMSACGEPVELMDFIGPSFTNDMSGYVFSLMQTFESDGSSGKLSDEDIFGYPSNSVFGDAVRSRVADVESKYNCDIQISTNSYDGSLLASMVLADSMKYEAIYSSSHENTMAVAYAKGFLPVSAYGDYVDYKNSEKYGTPNVFEINSYKGEMYGLTPISWVYKDPRAIGLTVFNMDLVNKYGLTNPREYLENETWNWNALETVLDTYYFKENDTEIYSMAARSFDFVKLMAMSNGMKLSYYDETGTPVSDFDSYKMTEALDWYNRFVAEYADNFTFNMTGESISWVEMEEAFCDDQDSMACITAPNVVYYDIIYKLNEFAILPFPSGPSGVYGEWASALEAAECFSVFSSAEAPEFAFTIIDDLAEPLSGYETKDSIAEYLAELALYDTSDAEVVLNIYKYGDYTYWTEDDGFILDVMYKFAAKSADQRTPAEVISSYKTKVEEYIDEYILPNISIYDYFE